MAFLSKNAGFMSASTRGSITPPPANKLVSKIISHLPSMMSHEGVHFEFRIDIEMDQCMRMWYPITKVGLRSKHYKDWREKRMWFNPFIEKPDYVRFLWQSGKIVNDQDLEDAIEKFANFMIIYESSLNI